MTRSREFINLASRLYETIVGNVQTFSTWGFYLLHADFDKEPELRNKVGVIWVCSLLDSIEAQHRFLPDIENEAIEQGYESLAENARQLQNFCLLVAELLETFSKEEQILLCDLRNQFVHSYFSNRHRDRVRVKYSADGRLVTDDLSNDEYSRIVNAFFETGKSVDEVVAPLVARALDLQRHRYWRAIEAWQKDKDRIYETFLNGDTIRIDV